jgi:magnesium and cobalt transporter
VREKTGRWRVKAQTDLSDFNQVFKTEFADEEHTTVGGLVIGRFGRLPKRGESVTIGGLRFHVLRADSRRLYTLLVERLKESAA